MRRSVYIPVALIAAAAFTFGAVQAKEKVLATVNGEAITEETFNLYLQQRAAQGQQNPAEVDRKAVLEQLISRELIYQDAVKNKLEKDEAVQRELALQREETLIGAAIRKRLDTIEVDDARLRQEYDKMVASTDVQEHKARHILSESEDAAKAIIAELDKGAKFADLAKEKSTGPSAKDGGDLGWFNPQQMVPEFSAAAAKLDKGEYTKSPVKTQFGWHVILLEDRRKATPPPFEQVKPQLQQMMMSEQLNAYVDELRAKAKVKVD